MFTLESTNTDLASVLGALLGLNLSESVGVIRTGKRETSTVVQVTEGIMK